MLVLPGGGYLLHAEQEAEPVAEWVASLGWRARVVCYPVGARHPAPLDAVADAVRQERRAGATVVGVLGFSAGGHLAGLAAFTLRGAARPDLAVVGYPVVSLVRDPYEPIADRLLGPGASAAARDRVSLERLVSADAPPVFAWHTEGDPVVPASHTRMLADALREAGVPHEVHVLPGARHGSGLAIGEDAGVWTERCATWLRRFGAARGPATAVPSTPGPR